MGSRTQGGGRGRRTDPALPPGATERRSRSRTEAAPTELELTRAELQATRAELDATRAELESRKTALHRAWEELEISRDRYRDLYHLTPHGSLTLDREGRILEANLEAATLLHRRREALLRRSFAPFVPQASMEAFRQHVASCLDGRDSPRTELRLRRANGEEFQALLQSKPLQHDRTRSTCQMTLIDDTERWTAIQQLRATEERYHELADSISDPFFAFNDDLRCVYLNPAALHLCAMPADGWTLRPLEAFVPSPDVVAVVRPILLRVLQTDRPESFLTSWPTAGEPIFLEAKVYRSRRGLSIFARDISVRMAQEAERDQLIGELAEAREQAEQRASEAEQGRRQLERTMRDLARSNRELDQFALVVAHDLSEPLRTISGFSQLLRSRHRESLNEQAVQYLEQIAVGAGRMRQLLDSLLGYARSDERPPRRKRTDLNVVLEKAVLNLSALIEATAPRLSQERLPTVRADESQMIQVLQNLLANAMKFRRAGHAAIHVAAQERENDFVVRVNDDGIGIEPQHREKVFQIFQRLQGPQGPAGSGVGLATCRKLVESHRGLIWFESEPGQGSTFFFSLPKAD